MAMLLKVLSFCVLWLAAVAGVPLVLLAAFTYGLPAAGGVGLVLALVVWSGLGWSVVAGPPRSSGPRRNRAVPGTAPGRSPRRQVRPAGSEPRAGAQPYHH